MHSIVVVAFAALIAISQQIAIVNDLSDAFLTETTWMLYKKTYNLSIPADKDEMRKSIFLQNLRYIQKFNSENTHMTLEINRFGHLTNEEFVQTYLSPVNKEINPKLDETPNVADFKTVDWREKGVVNPIRNQGNCGSCWAFSAIGSIESAYALHTKKLAEFSEQDLVDCSWKEGNHGCGGGLMDYAFTYVIKNGITSRANYTYRARDGTCQHAKYPVAGKISSMVDIPSGSENSLTESIQKVGPVSVAIFASMPSFRFYRRGIYYDQDCPENQLNHGVVSVGVAEKYYIVRNSWGEDWGDNGYIKMSRNRNNNCGIASMSSYPVV